MDFKTFTKIFLMLMRVQLLQACKKFFKANDVNKIF